MVLEACCSQLDPCPRLLQLRSRRLDVSGRLLGASANIGQDARSSLLERMEQALGLIRLGTRLIELLPDGWVDDEEGRSGGGGEGKDEGGLCAGEVSAHR